ncbi:unnamed protein product [Euphydryas editha]|uniref:Uncharacterized protein n=1 Tax=Euphydryas editha TaxID=104508 RepID=A0AAU9TUI2_EUPED|nr:unnamed protein product [Euphydryas editha]
MSKRRVSILTATKRILNFFEDKFESDELYKPSTVVSMVDYDSTSHKISSQSKTTADASSREELARELALAREELDKRCKSWIKEEVKNILEPGDTGSRFYITQLHFIELKKEAANKELSVNLEDRRDLILAIRKMRQELKIHCI